MQYIFRNIYFQKTFNEPPRRIGRKQICAQICGKQGKRANLRANLRRCIKPDFANKMSLQTIESGRMTGYLAASVGCVSLNSWVFIDEIARGLRSAAGNSCNS
jgi:hypothetical protein